MTLGDFLQMRAASIEPWHCSSMAADWCVSLGHPDFAAAWRGINDVAECEAIQAEAGGLLPLWAVSIGDALPVVAGPLLAGDIAVVRALRSEAGAIWTGARWAIEAERGVHFLAPSMVEALGAWRP